MYYRIHEDFTRPPKMKALIRTTPMVIHLTKNKNGERGQAKEVICLLFLRNEILLTQSDSKKGGDQQ